MLKKLLLLPLVIVFLVSCGNDTDKATVDSINNLRQTINGSSFQSDESYLFTSDDHARFTLKIIESSSGAECVFEATTQKLSIQNEGGNLWLRFVDSSERFYPLDNQFCIQVDRDFDRQFFRVGDFRIPVKQFSNNEITLGKPERCYLGDCSTFENHFLKSSSVQIQNSAELFGLEHQLFKSN